MRPEHVRLAAPERIFGQKNLLQTQLETINLLKHYDAYKALRTEELVLKIALKNKIAEAKATLELLDRLLPKPTMQPTENNLKKEEQQKKEKLSLEQEVEEIKQKLSRLR